jgi:hypothetical protein
LNPYAVLDDGCLYATKERRGRKGLSKKDDGRMKPTGLIITCIGTPNIEDAVVLAVPLLLNFINEKTKRDKVCLLSAEQQGPLRCIDRCTTPVASTISEDP